MSTPRQVSSNAGIVVAAILCPLLGLCSAFLSVYGLFIGFYSDACGDRGPCHEDELSFAVMLGMIGPPVVAMVLIVIAIIRGILRRRFVWILPLAGFILVPAVSLLAASLGAAAIELNFWTGT